MQLVRDVLDKPVSDRRGEEMGRVDGVVLQVEEGRPPRVVRLELGGEVPWRRLSPRLVRWIAALRRRVGPRETEPTRLPWSAVVKKDNEWLADVDARETPARAWEDWLAEHLVRRLGGGGP
jgi:sporulation protein YlmC with PRC-barrel domain